MASSNPFRSWPSAWPKKVAHDQFVEFYSFRLRLFINGAPILLIVVFIVVPSLPVTVQALSKENGNWAAPVPCRRGCHRQPGWRKLGSHVGLGVAGQTKRNCSWCGLINLRFLFFLRRLREVLLGQLVNNGKREWKSNESQDHIEPTQHVSEDSSSSSRGSPSMSL